MIHGNVGRKRPDLAERNRRGLSKETRMKISKSRKNLAIVYRPNNPCPRCNSIHVISVGSSWKCGDCGKTWVKNRKKRKNVMRPDNPCPRCCSIYVVSYGEDWKCKECNRMWKKNPKCKGWRKNNLPEPKIQIGREEMIKLYKELGSQSKVAKKLGVTQGTISNFMKKYNIKSNPKYVWNRTKKEQSKINKKISKALKGNTNWRFSHQYPNSEEKKLIRFFKKWNLPFKYVGDGSFKIDGKCPDFIYKEKRALIEFFGELWHEEDDEPNRIKFFKDNGWGCLVIWGKECRGKCRFEKTYSWERSLYDKIMRWLAGLD